MAECALQDAVRGISIRLQELRSQREHVRRKVISIKGVWNLPEQVRLAAVWIYERCDWSSEPSVLFLQSYAKRRQWPAHGRRECCTIGGVDVFGYRHGRIARIDG